MNFVQICALVTCVCLMLLFFSRRQEEISVLLLLLLYVGLFLYGLPALGTVLRRMQALLSDIELLHFDILLKCGGVLMICAVATTVAACVGKKEIGEILDFIALLEVLLLCRPLFEDLIFAAREILG